jgi:hypothetical protein
MKLAASMIAVASASHYRGGTLQVSQLANGKLGVTNTQTWRKGSDLYSSPGCRTTAQSSSSISGRCSGGACSTSHNVSMYYTALFVGSDYCYGDGNNEISKPSGAFSWGWSSCCWVSYTTDSGSSVSGGSMNLKMSINDVNNNTPKFKLPPLWMIMAGCGNQQIDLAPTDADGDSVRCRWATSSEAGGAYTNPSNWPSLSLDAANCIVKYDGTKDSSSQGVKPIALMMEDVAANGSVKSSIPVQFLAQVWTPNMNARSIRYPDWFGGEESANHVDVPVRGRRSTPSYCSATPEFVAPTPADGHKIVTSGSVSFTLAASSKNGSIKKFSYQAPSGMSCSSVNSSGQITCNWSLSAAQMNVASHSFCYDATDNIGLLTPRQCLTIEPSSKITNIAQMAAKELDGSGKNGFTASNGHNYGCAGRGKYEAFTGTLGSAVDDNDHAFYAWKKCVQCASSNPVPAYDYDADNNSCAASANGAARGVCECDKALVQALYNSKPTNSNYSASKCVASGGAATLDCCNYNTHFWGSYNVATQCCDKNAGVKEVGTC